MSLEVVHDPAELSFRDMMVFDYGFVVFSPEQGSDDLLLLSLVEGCMGHA